jgi:nitrogen-specific signal transduction histidine kinase
VSADGASLLNFLDAPVVVGDPEGRVIFVNPAFEETFEFGAQAQGMPFAELFQGGGREAFLMAVAQVCQTGETVRFRLREDGRGYIGVASPIEAAADRVGVMILLSDEPFSLQRLSALQRDIESPLDELGGLLDELVERASASGPSEVSQLAVAALQAAERARKSVGDLRSIVTVQSSPAAGQQRLDPVKTVRTVAGRVADECEQAGVTLELLVSTKLPPAIGDGDHLETVLLRMLRDRIQQCDRGDVVTLGVRTVQLGAQACAAFSLVAPSLADPPDSLRRVRDSIAALGGFRHVCVHTASGRSTVIPLPLDG